MNMTIEEALAAATLGGASAITAVAKDECGIVLLASPDGERFRMVERLARTATEAKALYDESSAPTLTADEVRHLYGEDIARLRLGRV